jgi:hypothetical protein
MGRENEDGVKFEMEQTFSVDLNRLRATLEIEESGHAVHYSVELAPDRSDALIEKMVMSNERDEVIERKSALLTLDQLRGDAPHDVEWARSDAVVWAARGLWGIPLRFGSKEKEPSVVVHSRDVATGEVKTPPLPVRQASRKPVK